MGGRRRGAASVGRAGVSPVSSRGRVAQAILRAEGGEGGECGEQASERGDGGWSEGGPSSCGAADRGGATVLGVGELAAAAMRVVAGVALAAGVKDKEAAAVGVGSGEFGGDIAVVDEADPGNCGEVALAGTGPPVPASAGRVGRGNTTTSTPPTVRVMGVPSAAPHDAGGVGARGGGGSGGGGGAATARAACCCVSAECEAEGATAVAVAVALAVVVVALALVMEVVTVDVMVVLVAVEADEIAVEAAGTGAEVSAVGAEAAASGPGAAAGGIVETGAGAAGAGGAPSALCGA